MNFRENAIRMAETFESRARHAEREARYFRETAADLRTRVAVEDARGGDFGPGWYDQAAEGARTLRGTCPHCGGWYETILRATDPPIVDAAVRDVCGWMEAHYAERHPDSDRRPFNLKVDPPE